MAGRGESPPAELPQLILVAAAAASARQNRRRRHHEAPIGLASLDRPRTTITLNTIELANGSCCFCIAGHFHEAETFTATSITVHNDFDGFNSSTLGECIGQASGLLLKMTNYLT